jgi:hypothetical protein
MKYDQTADLYGEWIAQLADWEVFVTLTYDPKKHPWCPSDRETWKHWRWWIHGQIGPSLPGLRAVGAIEHHASGWPHVHSLVGWPTRANPSLPLARYPKVFYEPWFEEHGYARVDTVTSTVGAAAYVSKYLTKTLGNPHGPGLMVYPDPLRSS